MITLILFLWHTNGTLIAGGSGNQFRGKICIGWFFDSYVIWEDSLESEIFLQSISNQTGTLRWNSPLNLSGNPYPDRNPDLLVDGYDGSSISVWEKNNGNFNLIYAKRVDNSGNISYEIQVSQVNSDQRNPLIEHDRLFTPNSFICLWEDNRNGTWDIYAQRIVELTGDYKWGLEKLISSNSELIECVETMRNIFVFYRNLSTGNYYVSLVDDAVGNVIWIYQVPGIISKNALPVNTSYGTGSVLIPYKTGSGSFNLIHLESDETVNFDINIINSSNNVDYVVVSNYPSTYAGIFYLDSQGNKANLYASLLDYSNGSFYFRDLKINSGSFDVLNGNIAVKSTSDTAFIVVYRDTLGRILAQKVSLYGYLKWSSPSFICDLSSEKVLYSKKAIVSDNYQGAIILWMDKRGGDFDVYAMRVKGDGVTDFEPPNVSLLYPSGGENFQGYDSVFIKWQATDNDTVTSVVLKFSQDAGATWEIIDSLNYNPDSLLWIVPNVSTNWGMVNIKVYDGAGNYSEDNSGFFTISQTDVKEISSSNFSESDFPVYFYSVSGRRVKVFKRGVYFMKGKRGIKKILYFFKGSIPFEKE